MPTSKRIRLTINGRAFEHEVEARLLLVDYLREKYNIVVRTIGSEQKGTAGVRVSTHIFVALKDVDLLAEGIKSYVELRP